MRLTINNSYHRDIRGVSVHVQKQAAEALLNVLDATSVTDIDNIKHLVSYKGYHRIRIGQHRIGLRWDGEQFFAERISKRGDFYKIYPPK